MVLLHNVIEILDLTDRNRGPVLGIITFDRCFIGRASVDRDLFRYPMAADCLGQKPFGSLLVALLGAQKVCAVSHTE
jgi:hypothetical protein